MVKVVVEPTAEEEPKPERPRKSRWKLKLFVLMLIALAVAPSLLSLSGQVPAVFRKVQPKLAEVTSFDSITLHWWAPVEIRGLKVREVANDERSETSPTIDEPRELLAADRVVTIEPLWQIVLNAGRGSGVVVSKPQVNVATDDHGSNLDRTLKHVFGEPAKSGSSRFPFRITINDGALRVQSYSKLVAAGEKSSDIKTALKSSVVELTDINGTLSTMNIERWLPAVSMSAEIRSSGVATSRRSGSDLTSPRLAAGLDQVVSDFPDVPLDELAGANADGDETAARIQVQLNPRADDKGRQTIQIGARGVDLRLLQPLLAVAGVELLAEGTISGGIDARLAGADLKDGFVGRLLLAGEQIRLRQTSWAEGEWLKLGALDASGAMAVADDGVLVQDLKLSSDIARLNGAGELRRDQADADIGAAIVGDGSANDPDKGRNVELNGAIDLAKLSQSLRRTLGLHDDVSIENGMLQFGLKGLAESDVIDGLKFGWQITSQLDQLRATRAGQPIALDSNTTLQASGLLSNGQPVLTRARVTAPFGTIDCAPVEADWQVSGNVQPNQLWQQLRQFVEMPQPGLTGDVAFKSRVAMMDGSVILSDMQVRSADVNAGSRSLTISPSQPLMTMLDGSLDVQGSGAAVRTLIAPWHDASWLAAQSQVTGKLTASPGKDLEVRLQVVPGANTARVGAAVIPANAGIQSPRIGYALDSRVRGNDGEVRTVSRPTMPESALAIDEADIDLALNAVDAGREFQISRGTVKLPGLAALISGTVKLPDDEMLVDLTADTSYDLDVLSRRWFSADSGVQLSGQGRDMFRVTGSPSSIGGSAIAANIERRTGGLTATARQNTTGFAGNGKVNWTSANVLGLQLGQANINAAIENSLLRADPIRCTLNGGELNVMPQYDLASSRFQLGTGSRVQNVQLTPELCRTWLGYVAPMLADSAEVSGQVSARVERFLWDMNVPERSDVSGQLTIHQAAAAPGSSVMPLLEVAELLHRRGANSQPLSDRSLTFPEQTVPVQIRQGAVIHDSLVMELAGYRIKSSGAVGLNQQLQLTLDVPLEKSSASASGRSVKVPLRGTVSRPQPDVGGLLQSLGAQKLQDKIGEKLNIDQQLQKGIGGLLDKL